MRTTGRGHYTLHGPKRLLVLNVLPFLFFFFTMFVCNLLEVVIVLVLHLLHVTDGGLVKTDSLSDRHVKLYIIGLILLGTVLWFVKSLFNSHDPRLTPSVPASASFYKKPTGLEKKPFGPKYSAKINPKYQNYNTFKQKTQQKVRLAPIPDLRPTSIDRIDILRFVTELR